MITIKYGDLLDAKEFAICHQVNCMGVMGSGVAKAIYTKWPQVKEEYIKFCANKPPYDLLGETQLVSIADGLKYPQFVVNIFGQLNYGRSKVCYTDYGALEEAFTRMNRSFAHQTIAFPYEFACGLAGGVWVTIEKLMLECMPDVNITIYMKEVA